MHEASQLQLQLQLAFWSIKLIVITISCLVIYYNYNYLLLALVIVLRLNKLGNISIKHHDYIISAVHFRHIMYYSVTLYPVCSPQHWLIPYK